MMLTSGTSSGTPTLRIARGGRAEAPPLLLLHGVTRNHGDLAGLFPRLADDWRLIATVVDLRASMLGRRPCPDGEIWISDSDLIIVPKSKILRANNIIELVFTKGLYGIFPFSGNVSYTYLSSTTPVIVP